nr:MAG TPA: hypothetical protein [Caudoviricetes sp.]
MLWKITSRGILVIPRTYVVYIRIRTNLNRSYR